MKIPDEVLDYVAEKYIELGLDKSGTPFVKYLSVWLKANNYKGVA